MNCLAVAQGRAYGAGMATLTQSELGETAAKLLQEAGERPVIIVDGDREVAAIVSIEDFEVVRKARIERVLRAFDGVAEDAKAAGINERNLAAFLAE
jgi:PHD/YefM family antitoxin component YafN of YafNO toxin-antitoxin module